MKHNIFIFVGNSTKISFRYQATMWQFFLILFAWFNYFVYFLVSINFISNCFIKLFIANNPEKEELLFLFYIF